MRPRSGATRAGGSRAILAPVTWTWRSVLPLLLLSTSCTGSVSLPASRGRQPPSGQTARMPARARVAPAVEPPEPRVPGRPFAETPLSAFAEQLAELALAAVQRRPLPPSPVPTRTPLGEASPLVEWWPPGAPRPRHLEVLAVGIEVDLVLKRGEPPESGTPTDRFGVLRATLVVSRHGLRVVSLRPGIMSPHLGGGAPPSGLEGLTEAARALVAALRRGEVSSYQLTEEDRRLLHNDAVWAQLHEDGPPLARARQVAPLLEGLPDTPLAYRLDEVGVLVRDEDERLYSLTLELDPQGGSFVLATSPLVQVRRLWPH